MVGRQQSLDFLGRVNLIKPVSNVRSCVHTYTCVRTSIHEYVRTSIRPQKCSSIAMKFGL